MELKSPAFAEGGAIPRQYTCDGADRSPPLAWSGVPAGSQALALIVDDPDAPGKVWVHWVLYDMPPDRTELPENAVPDGAVQGTNDFRKTSYGGPCPPGGTHRYVFTLYALDAPLKLPAGASKEQVLAAMEGHVLGQARLTGRYARG
jgi:hypothetical protein